MKRVLVLTLVLCICFGLWACSLQDVRAKLMGKTPTTPTTRPVEEEEEPVPYVPTTTPPPDLPKTFHALLQYIRSFESYDPERTAYTIGDTSITGKTEAEYIEKSQYLLAHDDNKLGYLYNYQENQTGFRCNFAIQIICDNNTTEIYYSMDYREIKFPKLITASVSGRLDPSDWSIITYQVNDAENYSAAKIKNRVKKEVDRATAFMKAEMKSSGKDITFDTLFDW